MGYARQNETQSLLDKPPELHRAASLAVSLMKSVSTILSSAKRGCKRSPALVALEDLADQISNNTTLTLKDCAEIGSASCYLLLRVAASSWTSGTGSFQSQREQEERIRGLLAPMTMLLDVSDRIEGLVSSQHPGGGVISRETAISKAAPLNPSRLWRKLSESQEELDKQIWYLSRRDLYYTDDGLHCFVSGQQYDIQETILHLFNPVNRSAEANPADGMTDPQGGPQDDHDGRRRRKPSRNVVHDLRPNSNEMLSRTEARCRRILRSLVLSDSRGATGYLRKCQSHFLRPFVLVSVLMSGTCPERQRSHYPYFGAATDFGSPMRDVDQLLDCSAWWIEQTQCQELRAPSLNNDFPLFSSHGRHAFWSSEAGAGWENLWSDVFPNRDLRRHFALRATYCAIARFRPLNPDELFAAATTQVLANDPDWRMDASPIRSPDDLMKLCRHLLQYDNVTGHVQLKTRVRELQTRNLGPVLDDAHYFMTLVCLAQLEMMQQYDHHLVFLPWTCYNDMESRSNEFPLHKYVITFGLAHYRRAEPSGSDLPQRLHQIIVTALLREKQIAVEFYSRLLEQSVHAQSLDLAFEFCRLHGLAGLRTAYLRMGANPSGDMGNEVHDFSLKSQRSDSGDPSPL